MQMPLWLSLHALLALQLKHLQILRIFSQDMSLLIDISDQQPLHGTHNSSHLA